MRIPIEHLTEVSISKPRIGQTTKKSAYSQDTSCTQAQSTSLDHEPLISK
ncbi:hypothetical protein NTGHW29_780045 [Candidatus Nitrotoga sp. HW29]|nr:hypothetical protein NTGHW29_780045 [Candidatus Nitrotoga sp. HW29]